MLLIDAYNVTHALAARGRSSRRGEVGDLLSLLATSRYAKREVTLVCDGGPRHRDPIELQQLAGLLAGVQTRRVLYAGDGREADDLVEQLLKESNQPRAILVVSSDRRLQQAAAFLGAGTLGSKEFLEHLYADMRRGEAARSRPTDGLDSLTLEDWERYFGLLPGLGPTPGSLVDTPGGTGSKSRRPTTATTRGQRRTTPKIPEQPNAWLDEARRIWASRFDPKELDMEQWLKKHPPGSSRGPDARREG